MLCLAREEDIAREKERIDENMDVYTPVCGAALTRSTSVSILVFAFNFVPENMEPPNVERVVFKW